MAGPGQIENPNFVFGLVFESFQTAFEKFGASKYIDGTRCWRLAPGTWTERRERAPGSNQVTARALHRTAFDNIVYLHCYIKSFIGLPVALSLR